MVVITWVVDEEGITVVVVEVVCVVDMVVAMVDLVVVVVMICILHSCGVDTVEVEAGETTTTTVTTTTAGEMTGVKSEAPEEIQDLK